MKRQALFKSQVMKKQSEQPSREANIPNGSPQKTEHNRDETQKKQNKTGHKRKQPEESNTQAKTKTNSTLVPDFLCSSYYS